MSAVLSAQVESCKNPCRDPLGWSSFNVFQLTLTRPDQPGSSTWKGRFDADSNDIQIDVDITDGRNSKSGKIMVVGGRFMAVRGPITEPGYEIDSLDAPVLYYQLLTRLLAAALPNGAEGIRGKLGIDFKDKETGIQFATPSAQGLIQAPWEVTGEVFVVESDMVDYKLTLTSEKSDGSTAELSFDGRLSKTSAAKINDATSIAGWKVFGLGIQTRDHEQGKTHDYGAGRENVPYKTVAEMRNKIADADYPGKLDQSRDFTGFWKTSCDNAFGLSIAHYGTDGKYTVTFCGPGGCGDPAEERKTFINKDPEYEVISDTELRIGNSEHRETYHKCTTETHPVLRYKHD